MRTPVGKASNAIDQPRAALWAQACLLRSLALSLAPDIPPGIIDRPARADILHPTCWTHVHRRTHEWTNQAASTARIDGSPSRFRARLFCKLQHFALSVPLSGRRASFFKVVSVRRSASFSLLRSFSVSHSLSVAMEAIKKKMMAMKLEKENAFDQ